MFFFFCLLFAQHLIEMLDMWRADVLPASAWLLSRFRLAGQGRCTAALIDDSKLSLDVNTGLSSVFSPVMDR